MVSVISDSDKRSKFFVTDTTKFIKLFNKIKEKTNMTIGNDSAYTIPGSKRHFFFRTTQFALLKIKFSDKKRVF